MFCQEKGYDIGTSLERRHNSLRSDFTSLRPFLDSSAQTTLGKVLDFFRKTSKRRFCVFLLVFFKLVSKSGFQGVSDT